MSKLATLTRLLVPLAGLAAVALTALWFVDDRVARLWFNTAWLAAGACLVALPVGTLAAVAIFKTDVPGRRLAAILLTAMLFVPLFLVTGAWDAGFGIQGWHTLATNPHLAHQPWLAGWRAAMWVHGLAAVPWVALVVGAGLRGVEAELEEDAALDASPAKVLWHVTIPRIRGAISVAALWVAIVASAEISVTDFFQVRTFAEEVYTQSALGAFDFANPKTGAESPIQISAEGMWLGVVLCALLAIAAMFLARQVIADLADPPLRPPWIWRLGRLRWPAAILLWSILALVAGVPLGNLIYKAGIAVTMGDAGRVRYWSAMKVGERLAAAPREFAGEMETSLAIGTAAATAAAAIGLPFAWSLRNARRTPWLRLTFLAICLVIPGPLLGIGLIHLLNQPPDSPLALLAPLYDSYFAPWLVQMLRALPPATLILWAALATVPQAMLDAATADGAGSSTRLVRIALPQRWPALLAAWLIGLAIAVGELAATVLVMPPAPSTTLSVRVFQLLHYGVDDRAAAICLVFVAAVAVLTAIAAILFTREEATTFSPGRKPRDSALE